MSQRIHYAERGASATACGKPSHLEITYVTTWQPCIDCQNCLKVRPADTANSQNRQGET